MDQIKDRIVLQNATKILKGRVVLDHVSLELERGGIFGFSGRGDRRPKRRPKPERHEHTGLRAGESKPESDRVFQNREKLRAVGKAVPLAGKNTRRRFPAEWRQRVFFLHADGTRKNLSPVFKSGSKHSRAALGRKICAGRQHICKDRGRFRKRGCLQAAQILSFVPGSNAI